MWTFRVRPGSPEAPDLEGATRYNEGGDRQRPSPEAPPNQADTFQFGIKTDLVWRFRRAILLLAFEAWPEFGSTLVVPNSTSLIPPSKTGPNQRSNRSKRMAAFFTGTSCQSSPMIELRQPDGVVQCSHAAPRLQSAPPLLRRAFTGECDSSAPPEHLASPRRVWPRLQGYRRRLPYDRRGICTSETPRIRAGRASWPDAASSHRTGSAGVCASRARTGGAAATGTRLWAIMATPRTTGSALFTQIAEYRTTRAFRRAEFPKTAP